MRPSHPVNSIALVFVLLVAASPTVLSTAPQDQKHPTSQPSTLIRIAVGRAPHQIAFSADEKRAYVAAAGSNNIAVVDTTRKVLLNSLAVPRTPLGVATTQNGLLVSRFASNELIMIDNVSGKTISVLTGGAKPSLFAGPFAGGRFLVSYEGANRCQVLNKNGVSLGKSYATGRRPFPGSATSDGRLAFVPNYDDGTLTIIDLWNETVIDTIDVGEHPSGATVLPGDIEVAVAVRGENVIKFVNTASHQITRILRDGIGKGPFSVVVGRHQQRFFVNNTASHDVSIVDITTHIVTKRQRVGRTPIAMAVTQDDKELWVSCEGSHEVCVIKLTKIQNPAAAEAPTSRPRTQVGVLGMIHGGHRTSKLWGIKQVEATIRKFKPDVVLCEIPPDRWQRIWKDFSERGAFDDTRIKPFPEYTDVLLPLKKELGFEVEPCAAWTTEMALLRRKRMKEFQNDPKKNADWQKYSEEEKLIASHHKKNPIVMDDPLVIHSDPYDARTKEELGPYDRYMNDYIGPGGWTNINKGHYNLIDQAIKRHPGKKLLITFGAGHKYWFLEQLRLRQDIKLLDIGPYLPTPSPSGEKRARRAHK